MASYTFPTRFLPDRPIASRFVRAIRALSILAALAAFAIAVVFGTIRGHELYWNTLVTTSVIVAILLLGFAAEQAAFYVLTHIDSLSGRLAAGVGAVAFAALAVLAVSGGDPMRSLQGLVLSVFLAPLAALLVALVGRKLVAPLVGRRPG